MSIRYLRIAAAAALLLVATACSNLGATGKDKDTVVVALTSFSREKLYPPAFDPGRLVYFGPMFDYLIGANPDGSLSTETGALKAWSPNKDASAWTLTLRSGMKWHDGTAVTADDLEFTLKEFGNKNATCAAICATLQTNMKSVKVTDKNTVVLTLKEPDVNIPAKFGPIESSIMLLPKHHVEKVGWDGFEKDPMGSGPWKFQSREIGQSIKYTANEDYWDADRRPKFKKLEIVLAPDQNTRLAMLKNGEADMIAISPDTLNLIDKDEFQILNVEKTIVSEILFFNSYEKDSPANNLKFRKALALTVDMDEVVEAFYPSGSGERASGDAVPFSPTTLGHDPDLKPYPYNVEEAKKLLKESGYDGSKVKIYTVIFPDGPEQKDVNEAIVGYWNKVGVKAEIVSTEFGPLLEKMGEGDFDAAPVVSGTGFPTSNRPSVLANIEPMMLSPENGGRFRTYWDPEKMDRYYDEVSKIVDEKERDERLREINRELYNEYWSIPIAMKSTSYAAGEKIKGWTPISGISKVIPYETLEPSGK